MNKISSIKIIRMMVLGLTTLGLALSLFLTYEYYQPEPIGCPFSATGENDCEVVRQSPYSSLFGVKLPVWGSMFYASISIVLILNLIGKFDHKYFSKGLFLISLWGIIFESYMTYIQIAKIHAICKWCSMVELISVSIFLVLLVEQIQEFTKKKNIEVSEKKDDNQAPKV